jgi:hypothetical protein
MDGPEEASRHRAQKQHQKPKFKLTRVGIDAAWMAACW